MVLWVESSKQEFTDCRDVCVCILYVDVVCVLFCASNTGLCAGRFECVCVFGGSWNAAILSSPRARNHSRPQPPFNCPSSLTYSMLHFNHSFTATYSA